jgi:hypothetical protein
MAEAGAVRPRVTAGRRANAATASAGMQLTGPRRAVLDALAACGPADAETVAACWRSRQDDDAGHLPEGLPALVSKLLWKLEALGWVEPADDGFTITAEGVGALADHPTWNAGHDGEPEDRAS